MKKAISLVLSVLLMCNFAFAEISVTSENVTDFDTEKLTLFKELIQDLYYKDISDKELYDAAIRGMFNALDVYSAYYNQEQTEVFEETTSGNYVGIGIKFEGNAEFMRVVNVFTGTPADAAGVMVGDYIVEVNGQEVYGMSTTKVASMIKGEEGTNVKIGLLRGDIFFVLDIERQKVQAESCSFNVLEKDIGYIKIEEFNDSTYTEVSKYVQALKALGMNKLILDLRDNSGGYVSQAVAVANHFVPKGVVTTLRYKNSAKDKEYVSVLKDPFFKLVVLVNENTASSAEILAGAIKDTKAGTLIGMKTYGKGVFQNMYNLKDGGSIKITTGVYHTPNGTSIDRVGIMPNILVEGADAQLTRAIEEVKKI